MLRELWDRLREKLHSLLAPRADGQIVHRRRRRRKRRFTFGQREKTIVILRWATLAGIALCVVLLAVGIGKLIDYGMESLSSSQSSEQLRQAYYETEAALPTLTPAPASETVTIAPATIPAAAEKPQTTQKPQTLKKLAYPDNPYLQVNSRFDKVRQKNADVVGWLTIDHLIDEAVVQRDNVHYMTHDHLGKQNISGAIFLDEIIGLEHRPYTLILYGHNMKSGAMFGSLRNYENLSFYKANPIISFDSIYEDGRYAIFSVAMVSVHPEDWNYLDVGKLVYGNVQNRNAVLTMLRDASVIDSGITVNADDQVLLLVTCMGDDSERRVVAARRIRADETESGVMELAGTSRGK